MSEELAKALARMGYVDRRALRKYAERDPNLGDDSWSPWLQGLFEALVVELDALELREWHEDARRRATDAAVIEAMEAPMRAEHDAAVEAASAKAVWPERHEEPRTKAWWPDV